MKNIRLPAACCLLPVASCLLCAVALGCQGRRASELDAEEKRWVAEERMIPPTGGPAMTPLAATPLLQPAAGSRQQEIIPMAMSAQPSVPSPETAVAAPAIPLPPSPAPAAKQPKATGGPLLPATSTAEHVRVSIYPSTIITCDGPLEMDYEHSKATFHDNVHVTDERGELFADVMEVFFTKTREISQVISTGNVRIVRGDDTAYCDRAVYLQQEGRVLLTGQPKLVLFPDTTKQALPEGKKKAADQRPAADDGAQDSATP